MTWLAHYDYDGIDFDWEYPTAQERGGHQGDGVNFMQFLKEFRDAISKFVLFQFDLSQQLLTWLRCQ